MTTFTRYVGAHIASDVLSWNDIGSGLEVDLVKVPMTSTEVVRAHGGDVHHGRGGRDAAGVDHRRGEDAFELQVRIRWMERAIARPAISRPQSGAETPRGIVRGARSIPAPEHLARIGPVVCTS